MKTFIIFLAALGVAVAAPKEAEAPHDEAPPPVAAHDECQSRQVGDDCDPGDVKCDQCDWCLNKTSSYFWCNQTVPENPFLTITGKWVLSTCAHGDLIDHSNPLANDLVGGLCTAWDDLPAAEKTSYLTDAKYGECGLARDRCLYGQEKECSGDYWFMASTLDPDSREDRSCAGSNIWDQASENCRPCADVVGCAGKC